MPINKTAGSNGTGASWSKLTLSAARRADRHIPMSKPNCTHQAPLRETRPGPKAKGLWPSPSPITVKFVNSASVPRPSMTRTVCRNIACEAGEIEAVQADLRARLRQQRDLAVVADSRLGKATFTRPPLPTSQCGKVGETTALVVRSASHSRRRCSA
ncbi:MAG: hypothetical protein U0231_13775 [Nitrospiraceae bacterium]